MLENIVTVVERYWSLFLSGLGYTLLLALITVVCGTLLGSLIALMRMARFRPLSVVATAFIEVIRGTPLLLQLYVFYFLVPKIMPFEIGEFTSVSMALVINSTAYVAEIIRAGILAVDRGQTEAARSLGMDSRQTMVRIVMPQAVKNILPALCNEFVAVVKETSLASTFFVGDLMTVFRRINASIFMTLEPLIVVGIIYFAVTFTMSKAVGVLERRLKYSD
ncbi:MAG TPA: amino acid ABC transporter permease [Firmicutes bacterium]|nr:amino acid ABC transporter permease [Bacillota bacterium]